MKTKFALLLITGFLTSTGGFAQNAGQTSTVETTKVKTKKKKHQKETTTETTTTTTTKPK